MEKSLYKRLSDAQDKLVMLANTTQAVYEGDTAREIGIMWFGGASLTLREINDVMDDVLDLCETPLKTVGMDAREAEAIQGAASTRTVIVRQSSIEHLKRLEKGLDDIANGLHESISGLAADVWVITKDIGAQAEKKASGGKSASDGTPEAKE